MHTVALCYEHDIQNAVALRRPAPASRERQIGGCKIGTGQGQAHARRQIEARTGAAPVLHCGTVPQRGGTSENMREAIAKRPLGEQGSRVPTVGNKLRWPQDVRRPSPRPQCRRGGRNTGWAEKKQSCCGTKHARSAWCAPGRAPVSENMRWSRFARRCPRPRVKVQTDHTGSQNATQRARNV